MRWFQQFCRNTGLMLHNIAKPIKDDAKEKPSTKVVKHEVEEEKISENITLKRTTIEEIQISPSPGRTNPLDPDPPSANPQPKH